MVRLPIVSLRTLPLAPIRKKELWFGCNEFTDEDTTNVNSEDVVISIFYSSATINSMMRCRAISTFYTSNFMPHFEHLSPSLPVTSGCMEQA